MGVSSIPKTVLRYGVWGTGLEGLGHRVKICWTLRLGFSGLDFGVLSLALRVQDGCVLSYGGVLSSGLKIWGVV